MSTRRKIEKVAIANRGEVAVRIIRACQELGLETVLLHSEADAGGFPARLADEAACIGPAAAGESYLSNDANIQAALSRGADAIHPGFGFLSENAGFAQACADNGLLFVGPSPESIRLFGDKISAKRLVMGAGAPVIPGYDGDDQSLERLIQEADKIGYPVIAKATGGGGGRGLKIIRERGEARAQIEAARREGESAFGSKKVFLEKYLGRAKHIEVQIFGDAGGRVHQLGVRECSVQRRHQKIIEESPAADLAADMTARICAAAAGIATMARYTNAGTVEFLVEDGKFYFMEMNTRLQVEHPVTEMVYGVDLVKAQLLTAMGQATGWDGLAPRGHAIECRLYAENPFAGGIPSTGRITGLRWPHGPGRRFESGVEQGDCVTSHYDSMIAKAVVWDETRARAIQKMKRTLADTIVFGVRTNIPLLQEILRQPDFELGIMTTQFFTDHFSGPLAAHSFTKSENDFLARLRTMVAAGAGVDGGGGPGQPQQPSPWTYSWS
jgi:acetyl/propionyl-CoA carboxylase alpha subunit